MERYPSGARLVAGMKVHDHEAVYWHPCGKRLACHRPDKIRLLNV